MSAVEQSYVKEIIEKELEAGFAMGPFHRSWLMERAPDKVKRNLDLARKHPHLVMSRQGFGSMDTNDGATAAFAAINTTAAEANIVGATQGLINQFCAISPNDAKAGKMYKVNFSGIYGNTGTPTVIWTPRWGSSTTPGTNVTLGASPTATTITGVTALAVFGEFMCTVRGAPPGATAGTAYGHGMVYMQIPVTNSQYAQDIPMGGTQGTIDTTGQGAAGCGLTINLTWGTSNAANTFTCQQFAIRSLN